GQLVRRRSIDRALKTLLDPIGERMELALHRKNDHIPQEIAETRLVLQTDERGERHQRMSADCSPDPRADTASQLQEIRDRTVLHEKLALEHHVQLRQLTQRNTQL